MARLFKEKPPLGDSKSRDANGGGGAAHRISSTTTSAPASTAAAVSGGGAVLSPPFGELDCDLSPDELRETAYEILVAACRSTGGRPLTYISQSERNAAAAEGSGLDAASSVTTTSSSSSSSSSSLHRSLTSTAASKVKKAFGLKSSSSSLMRKQSDKEGRVGRGARSVGELIRVQMGVSEHTDTRIRRGLLRIAAGQLGRRIETMVLPLELLQQFKESDFPNFDEYEAWKFRNLKILEAGLLLHPHLPLDKSDPSAQRLRQIIRGAATRPLDTGRNSESMQVLRDAVMSLTSRSFDGIASKACHWADGFPLNLHLYKMLLQVCFDKNEEGSLIEELEEVLEQIKKTWTVLGIDQMLHNLCFTWVLFQQFVSSGQMDSNLILAADNQLAEVLNDTKATKDPVYSKILNKMLASILGWVEKRLLAYHEAFHSGNIGSFESVVSLGISTTKILAEDLPDERSHKRKEEVDVARSKVEAYIRSSIRAALAQRMKQIDSNRQSSSTSVLSVLATEVGNLASKEKGFFSPILKKWHPLAAGVAVATLHSCFGKELKQFISGVKELSPDSIQVLVSADKLEKHLVEIAVEDAVDSEDGGKGIIREMPPYEAESAVANLTKAWIKSRLLKLQEWVNRNLKQETWNPGANKENFAASAVEILRIVDDALVSFFQLPISVHASVLPDLVTGLDQSLQHYVSKAKSGCGTRNTFVPALPPLTRCSGGSKLWKKKKPLNPQKKKSQVGSINGEGFSLPQLFVRLNTVNHIRTEVENFEKRILTSLKNVESSQSDIPNGVNIKFQLTTASCQEGIQQLCEATAFRIVFVDLSPVLWEGLYLGDPTTSRIDSLIRDLDPILAKISSSVHDRVRNRAITALMKACFDGFLLVLLAGGPFRAFYYEDSQIIEEDFKYLRDLYLADGDGIPEEVVEKASIQVRNILPLFCMDTASLIERFRQVINETYGPASKSKLPLPQTSGKWSPNEPNTILRVLCHRNDEMASKFLKKTYSLPTNV